MDEHFFIYNGFLFRRGRPVIAPEHPSFTFGDGIFETMRMHEGEIINLDLHFERLIKGMKVLEYETTSDFIPNIIEDIDTLSHKNHHEKDARIRLSVCRSENPFANKEDGIDYLVETEKVGIPVFDLQGVHTVIYKDSVKGGGVLSNLKTKNYLLNLMAYKYACAHSAQDGILLNGYGRICETTIANIYFIEGEKIFTPALSEGCVSGTVRKWLIQHCPFHQINILETECEIERILKADEVFISNAIKLVQPVNSIDNRNYPVKKSGEIFQMMKDSLF